MPHLIVHPDFARFRAALGTKGSSAFASGDTRLNRNNRHSLYYVPFHHVNRSAQIAIVGITPGPTQIASAYDSVRNSLATGRPDEEIFIRAKKASAFDGTMRERLTAMLDHARIPKLFGIQRSESLWGDDYGLAHFTSIIPHAAFRIRRDCKEKPFSGKFAEIQKSPILYRCFEEEFLPTLALTSPDTLYLALGPTVDTALAWCVAQGLLRQEQFLGALPHPSPGSGSQVDVFMGTETAESMHPDNPVHDRLNWLMRRMVELENAMDQKLIAMPKAGTPSTTPQADA